MEADTGRLRYAGFLAVLVAIALILAARLIYLFIADPLRFPINTIKIGATYHHISHKQLESILSKHLNASFFSLPVGVLYKEMVALEWTESVRIDRIWPDTLKITLIERVPVATYNNALVTETGKIFNEGGAGVDVSLPHLLGPINQQKEVLQVYQKLSKILSIYGLHANVLEWRENQAWILTLADGLKIQLGKQDLALRVTRFCKAYPAVSAQRVEQLVSIDLRYPRGMAVQWKQ